VLSPRIDLGRVRRSSQLLIAIASALAALPGSTYAQDPVDESHSPTCFSFWGVRLRAPVDTTVLQVGRCRPASEFAHAMGAFSGTIDDLLFGILPHEHNDSLPVLRALSSFEVCIHSVPISGATVFQTIMDSTVVHALFMWTEPADRPSADSLGGLVTELYGEPDIRERGVDRWSADSMDIYVESRSRLGYGVTITLSDARGCERFERLLHRGTPPPPERDRARCWEPVSGRRQ
jgi:hypothetical protein